MARRLSAILAADVVGYSALMAQDEAGTLSARCADTVLAGRIAPCRPAGVSRADDPS